MAKYNYKNQTLWDYCSNHNIEFSKVLYRINKYLKDDKCKKEYTIGIFRELLNSMEFSCNKKNIKLMNKNTPILLLSGEDDPVGKFGKGVKKIYDFILSVGIENVSIKLYPGLRHDIFHEKNNLEIFEDIYNFIK